MSEKTKTIIEPDRRFLGNIARPFAVALRDRYRPRIERRGEGDKAQRVIMGYAAVFYREGDPATEYWLWDDIVERIMPGAFDAALKDDDVRGLANHEKTWLLGRIAAKTLRLKVDDVGLFYEIDAPDTQAGRDTLTSLDRGDMDGSSFGFLTWGGRRGRVEWAEETREGQTVQIRKIMDLELVDVGPATFQAYTGTSAESRDRFGGCASAELEQRVKKHQQQLKQYDDDGEEIDMEVDLDEAWFLMQSGC